MRSKSFAKTFTFGLIRVAVTQEFDDRITKKHVNVYKYFFSFFLSFLNKFSPKKNDYIITFWVLYIKLFGVAIHRIKTVYM